METIKNFVKNWWLSLSDSTRDHIISAGRVFTATFFTCLFIAYKAGINWSWAAVGAIIGSALSSALKAAIQSWAPPILGGRKIS